jgi:hypothetical protein
MDHANVINFTSLFSGLRGQRGKRAMPVFA